MHIPTPDIRQNKVQAQWKEDVAESHAGYGWTARLESAILREHSKFERGLPLKAGVAYMDAAEAIFECRCDPK